MPLYEIEQYELHAQTYQVEADSEAEAIKKLFDGEADPLDGGLEYIEVAEDFGMPADDDLDLVDELENLGISCDAVIPSIRSIKEVK
jgi:hypothetical protein